MQQLDPALETLIRRADAQHLIDHYHVTRNRITLRVGARDLELPHEHAVRFLEGLLAGFERAMHCRGHGH